MLYTCIPYIYIYICVCIQKYKIYHDRPISFATVHHFAVSHGPNVGFSTPREAGRCQCQGCRKAKARGPALRVVFGWSEMVQKMWETCQSCVSMISMVQNLWFNVFVSQFSGTRNDQKHFFWALSTTQSLGANTKDQLIAQWMVGVGHTARKTPSLGYNYPCIYYSESRCHRCLLCCQISGTSTTWVYQIAAQAGRLVQIRAGAILYWFIDPMTYGQCHKPQFFEVKIYTLSYRLGAPHFQV